ncbi:mechanosensitive ion channel [Fragilaria crotonensis]|nr:mechanosensitive ion channel [Fragilaria crotonensis]
MAMMLRHRNRNESTGRSRTSNANNRFRRPVTTKPSLKRTALGLSLDTATTATTIHNQFVWDSQLAIGISLATTLSIIMDPLIQIMLPQQNQDDGEQREQQFQQTFLYSAAKSIPFAAQVYAYLSVMNWILLQPQYQQSPIQQQEQSLLFFSIPPSLAIHLRQEALQVVFTIWLAQSVSTAKRIVLKRAISGTRLGRVTLYDKLLDMILILVASAVVLSELEIDYGMRLQSIFAAGSLGAITFSLASRDLAENIVAGVVLQAWDAFEEGDDIRLGDGSEGTVLKIGLVETELCGYDNIVTMIPNSQLAKERVSNMSRITRSRFRQALRFQYKDIDKLPKILGDILEAIRVTCSPSLITDGSKPFQAVLTKYEPDHIEAQVTCHFAVPPGSGDYVILRQSVLLAIAKAMQMNQAEFALPSINYKVDDTNGSGQNSIL